MWSMAVTAHADLTRCSESCYVNSVTDSVTRSGYMYTKSLCRRCQINMIIRCFMIHIEQIVIQIADTAFSTNPVKTDGFKCKISHNCIDVMSQCLIYFDKYLFSRHHTSGYIM